MLHHFERSVCVQAAAPEVFLRLDDQARLAAHMAQRSAMMGGGRMTYVFDAGRGQAVGSHIIMGGSAFGLALAVDEVVIERDPPRRKVWQTFGATRLLIIDTYTMGFALSAAAAGTELTVWIDYTLPAGGIRRWLSPLPAALYARWCVRRMTDDAVGAFAVRRG